MKNIDTIKIFIKKNWLRIQRCNKLPKHDMKKKIKIENLRTRENKNNFIKFLFKKNKNAFSFWKYNDIWITNWIDVVYKIFYTFI